MRPIIVIAGVTLAVLLAPHARAGDPAPPEVSASALRALGLDQPNPLGPLFGQRAPRVEIEGDHVVVHMPIDARQPLPLLVADDVTLRGHAIGDGRWWFDAASLPSTIALGPGSTTPSVTVMLRTDGLAYHATFDPTYATENVQEATLPSVHAHMAFLDTAPADTVQSGTAKAAAVPIEFDVDSGVVTSRDHTTVSVGGVVQTTSESSVERLVVTFPLVGSSVRITVGHVSDDETIGDFSPEGGKAVAAAYAGFIASLKQIPAKPAGATTDALPTAARSKIKALFHAWRGELRSADERTEADDIELDVGDGRAPYHLDRLVLAGFGCARDGRLDIATDFELDGLRVPGLPAAYVRLIPRRMSVRPRLSGLDTDDLMTAFETMLDDPTGGEAAGRLVGEALVKKLAGHGPVSIGLDAVAIDFDGASVAGSGTLRFASADPSGVSGKADLRVTGIDTVVTELTAHAEMKDALAPLAFLKGLGQQDGTVMTWHLEFSAGKLTVNGQDLTAMIDKPG